MSNATTTASAVPSLTPVTTLPITSSPPPPVVEPTTIIQTTTSFSTFTPPEPSAPVSTAPIVLTTPATTVPPATAPAAAPTPPVLVTSVVVQSASSNDNGTPVVIHVTSTVSGPAPVAPSPTRSSSSISSSSPSSSGATPLSINGTTPGSPGGLTPGGRTAVAVVVPVAAVALIVLALLFLWRRRKQRKDAEELRRKEVEEYGFNPNNDPSLPPVGGTSPHGEEVSEMREADGAGYRGWGTTSAANRKASTTLSSGNGPIGMARSDSGSNPGGYHATSSPTAITAHNSDVQSGDPLVGTGSPNNGRPTSTDSETIAALGAGPVAMGNRQERDIHRGPSNASSAYTGANRSEASGDDPLTNTISSPQQYNNDMYDENLVQHGSYGDGSYGTSHPVIRDVQARRNTRIENPSVLPQQGNAGIAQNF